MKTIISAALLLASLNAMAINKCTMPDGSMVFQDAPCAGKGESLNVRPASGAAKAQPVAASGDTPKKSNAQRMEEQVASSQKDRRVRELAQHLGPSAVQAIRTHLQACRDEQARLEAAKHVYVQNLYGKTDAAQRASEQAAAAGRCDTKDRELRETAALLKRECTELGGCQ